MTDRSSAPRRRPRRVPAEVEAEIERLRRLRHTSTQIAATLAMPVSTVCAVLGRFGLKRLWKLGPLEPPNRYCRRTPANSPRPRVWAGPVLCGACGGRPVSVRSVYRNGALDSKKWRSRRLCPTF